MIAASAAQWDVSVGDGKGGHTVIMRVKKKSSKGNAYVHAMLNASEALKETARQMKKEHFNPSNHRVWLIVNPDKAVGILRGEVIDLLSISPLKEFRNQSSLYQSVTVTKGQS